MIPDFLLHPDPSFRGFSAQEIADLRALRELHRPWSSADRDHSGVPLIADDGTAHVVVMTIDLVEPHARRFWDQHASESFVLTNHHVQP